MQWIRNSGSLKSGDGAYGTASARLDTEQRALADQMTAYWASFIHGSAPSAPGQPVMPDQKSAPGTVLQLRTASRGGHSATSETGKAHNCDPWDAAAGS